MRNCVVCRHPTLEKLRRLNREAVQRFPAAFPAGLGLGDLGLILCRELEHRYYRCTPLNCWTFAHTGGDGVHFSLLARDGAIHEDSAVILTVPTAFLLDDPHRSLVVGEDLFDFLCLGVYRGYFCLEELAYHRELALLACTDPSWQPSEDWHYDVGFGVSEHQGQLLALLGNRFGLRPWPDSDRFKDLQRRYAGELESPAGLSW
jgi:hypothetical protein